MRHENENSPFVTRRGPSTDLCIENPKSFGKGTLRDIAQYQVLHNILQEIIIICDGGKVGLLLPANTPEGIKHLPWKKQRRIIENIVSYMYTADSIIIRKGEPLLPGGRICPN